MAKATENHGNLFSQGSSLFKDFTEEVKSTLNNSQKKVRNIMF